MSPYKIRETTIIVKYWNDALFKKHIQTSLLRWCVGWLKGEVKSVTT